MHALSGGSTVASNRAVEAHDGNHHAGIPQNGPNLGIKIPGR